MIRSLLLNLLACLVAAVMLIGVILIGISQLPDQIVFVEYGTGKCLAASVVQENKWHRISCHEFEAQGGYDKPYETQWGSREL